MASTPPTILQVKSLREKTGAGLILCKEALIFSSSDEAGAITWLRQKGVALADGKIGRSAREGTVGSYIHTGGKVGVLIEVNCETDFVAKSEPFQDLVRNLAMQVAACPSVCYVSIFDIPEETLLEETRIESGKADLSSKPEAIRNKIVEGRVAKRFRELSLMDQPYIKDNSMSIETYVENFAAVVGENIVVKRFVRFVLGSS
jgi:elongation factor Ts